MAEIEKTKKEKIDKIKELIEAGKLNFCELRETLCPQAGEDGQCHRRIPAQHPNDYH